MSFKNYDTVYLTVDCASVGLHHPLLLAGAVRRDAGRVAAHLPARLMSVADATTQ